jgi:hypothetical protein
MVPTYSTKNSQISKYPIYKYSDTPGWFLPAVKKILKLPSATPLHPPLQFDLTRESAVHNMIILIHHGNSIQNLISAYPGSILSPGSEFRSADVLEPLSMHHHDWSVVKRILDYGSWFNVAVRSY